MEYKKAGETLCTIYPRETYFTVMAVVGPKQKALAEEILPECSAELRDVYNRTRKGKSQRWLMIDLEDRESSTEVLYGCRRYAVTLIALAILQNQKVKIKAKQNSRPVQRIFIIIGYYIIVAGRATERLFFIISSFLTPYFLFKKAALTQSGLLLCPQKKSKKGA